MNIFLRSIFCCVGKKTMMLCRMLVLVTAFLYLSDVATLLYYPRRARSALGVDTVLTLDVCLYVCMLGL